MTKPQKWALIGFVVFWAASITIFLSVDELRSYIYLTALTDK